MKIKRFFEKISKIISYLPILWQDEDWDYEYLLVLMKFKLKRMRDVIYSNDIVTKDEKRNIVISINQTIDHINNYCDGINGYERVCGKLPFEIGFKMVPTDDGCYKLKTVYKETGEQLSEQDEERYSTHIIKAHNFQQEEWNKIFDTIKAKGQKWWD